MSLLLKALQKKDTPFCYLDSHAGTGRYNLQSEAAQKTGESQQGIARLWPARAQFPELLEYFSAIDAVNVADAKSASPHYYPGSPCIARFFLRSQDRMILLEQHPDEFAQLKGEFFGDKQAVLHQQDGYAGLKAFVPPKERRGLVLIDPPYESAMEFDQVMKGLRAAYERWPTGVFAAWYPTKDHPPVDRFHRALRTSGIRKILLAEFSPYPYGSSFRLSGCGMVLINPPWQLDTELELLMPRLLDQLRIDSAGSAGVSWLTPE